MNIKLSLTDIHNWSLQHFSQDYNLDSRTSYVVCLILSLNGWPYNLKATPKERFLRNFSLQFLFTLRVLPVAVAEDVVDAWLGV